MSISSVQDKVIIITGCSSGIGLATARLFLERQALVFGIDIGAVPQKLADAHSTFTFHQTNLTDNQAAEHAVAKCIGKYNRIDVLVNCAGVSDGWSSADTLHEDEWESVMSINLTVPIRMMKAVLPAMKSQKNGSIVNVASKAGLSGAAAGIAYTASKHGLVGATKNVAWRFHQEGIRCNGVLPGGVATNIASSVQMEHFDSAGFNSFFPIVQLHVSKDSEGTPVPVIGVDDVARGIAFLASDEAKLINGAMIPIDNAWSTI
ncbi:NAD(P)-binding protein [Plenodomus tracheiphilus IPT5]|uniref:3-oxoacyl-[acyl-carrier-protein] reductase n=1 Tax=Plenodomus tracheiphilus IPT5 TaxID=1408161 RepID=A0A6A7BIR5_9PLEO|nr:NAD(P)-binding protein [Plenodomus tracheiphilus IPT5]